MDCSEVQMYQMNITGAVSVICSLPTRTIGSKSWLYWATELNNENIFVLQIGASLCHKLGQVLQSRAIITNLGITTITVE